MAASLKAAGAPLWDVALSLASGAGVTALMGQSQHLLAGWEQALQTVKWLTAAILALGLSGSVWVALKRRPGYERHALLLIWLAAPLLPQMLTGICRGIHYMQVVMPALFLSLALGWTQLVALPRRLLPALAAVALLVVVAIQTGALVAVLRGVVRYPTAGGFGLPLSSWLRLQQGLRSQAVAGQAVGLDVLGMDGEGWAEGQVLDYVLRRTMAPRYVPQGARPAFLLPLDHDRLVLAARVRPDLARTLGVYGKECGTWPLGDGGEGLRLYRVSAGTVEQIAARATFTGAGTFENGMSLLALDMPQRARPGSELAIVSYWLYAGQGSHPAATAFVHLVAGDGRAYAQDDGFALPRDAWRRDEVLVQWFFVPLPEELPQGDYWLFTGMYSVADMSRANVLDEHGQWLADGLRLGPVHVGDG